MQNTKALAPFSCQYSPQIPELLQSLNCSIAISTYQAGKLVFISAKDNNSLVQLPRHFDKPMGIAHQPEKDKLALACRDEVQVFSNSGQLANHYPKAPNKYDALYMPRVTYHTGQIDVHDLSFGVNDKLFAVNTLFSCIAEINDDYNFTPYWQPPFIDKLSSEDRCHLNGMAMQNGLPKYVSAFGTGNTPQSWRDNVSKTGIIMDVESNEMLATNLAMPHTPRLFNGELYTLLSATGELIKIDTKTGKYDVVVKLDGFVRGMALQQDYLFVGLSKLRQNSSSFAQLEIAKKSNQAGIAIVHLPTGSVAGHINYLNSLDEIYDVHLLPGKMRPNILNTIKDDHKQGITTNQSTFWRAPQPKENQ